MVTLKDASWFMREEIEAGASDESEVVRDAINRAQLDALTDGYSKGEYANWNVPVYEARFLAPPELEVVEAAAYNLLTGRQIAEMRGVLAFYNPVRRRCPPGSRLVLQDMGDGHVTLCQPRGPSTLVIVPDRGPDTEHEDDDRYIVLRGNGVDGERIYTTDANGTPIEGVKVPISTHTPQYTQWQGKPLLFTQLTGAWKTPTRYRVLIYASDTDFPQKIADNKVPRMDLLARLGSWETQCSRRLYHIEGCRPSCSCVTVFGRARFRPATSFSDPLLIQDLNILRHYILKSLAERRDNVATAAYHQRQIARVSNSALERHRGPHTEAYTVVRDFGFGDIRNL